MVAQEVFGTEYSELDVSYYITAFEMLSSTFAVVAIVFWRWRTNVTVEKVCRATSKRRIEQQNILELDAAAVLMNHHRLYSP